MNNNSKNILLGALAAAVLFLLFRKPTMAEAKKGNEKNGQPAAKPQSAAASIWSWGANPFIPTSADSTTEKPPEILIHDFLTDEKTDGSAPTIKYDASLVNYTETKVESAPTTAVSPTLVTTSTPSIGSATTKFSGKAVNWKKR